MRLARRLLMVALFGAVLVLGWRFAADHSASVVIHTPVWKSAEISLWLALLAAFVLGAVSTGLAAAYQMARMGLLSRRYRKMIRDLEAEVHQLRNLPLTNDEPTLGEAASEPGAVPATGRALGRGA